MKHLLIILLFVITGSLSSCKKDSINLSKKEYSQKKNQGFWVLRNKKAINYNNNVAKPKRDKHMKKLARENKQIEKYNNKQRKHLQDNNANIRAHGNGSHYKTFEHH